MLRAGAGIKVCTDADSDFDAISDTDLAEDLGM